MRIERGNRKLAALAMTLAALVIGFPLLVYLQANDATLTAYAVAVVGSNGTTVWGNVQAHRAGAKGRPDEKTTKAL